MPILNSARARAGRAHRRPCALILLLIAACTAPSSSTDEPVPAAARGASQAIAKAPAPPPAEHLVGPELRTAGEGPVADLVVRELEAAAAEQRTLVVYVGAPWCEPCVAFHDALLAGSLDDALPATRFLEFNMDRDQERLAAAGYTSRLIPLFVLPAADGSASDRRIEGGIKGAGAVDHLTGRLRPLLSE